MPELPEVESLAAFLRGHAVGYAVARADAASFSVLKTFDPPLADLSDPPGDHRSWQQGKFLDLATDQGLHLIDHAPGPRRWLSCARSCRRRRRNPATARWPSG